MNDLIFEEEIPYSQAKEFVEIWHYSGCFPKGSHITFGWSFFDSGYLYAIADFGNGVNPYQSTFLSRVTGKEVTNKNMVELKRLARVEPKCCNAPLSKFLSLCGKALKRRGIRFIVSFSDPAHGHSGGIYRASGFSHIGQTLNAERHDVTEDGVVVHRRRAYRHAKANGISLSQARDVLGVRPVETPKKDRWFRDLGE
jgi:hypothetical protein